MSADIYDDTLQKAQVFGQAVLFSEKTVARNIVPDGWYCYSLEGTKESPWQAAMLVKEDGWYYCGTVLSPVPLMDKEPVPLDGQISLSGEETTLADFCQQNGLTYPKDKRQFVFCPDPLADADPEIKPLLQDTMRSIQNSGLYKAFMRGTFEDYYRMELSYILADPGSTSPERISAVAVCMGEEGYLDDEMTYLFQPFSDKEPIHLLGANSLRDLYEPLGNGSEILYMSIGYHAALWGELADFGPDALADTGVAEYLQYCAANGITPERIREAEPILEDAVEIVAQMMEEAHSPEGMTMT